MGENRMQVGGNRHLWVMLIGCLAPLAALIAVFAFGIPVNAVLLVGLVLLCPLLHFILMGRGGHTH